eukprot:gene41364-55952_t
MRRAVLAVLTVPLVLLAACHGDRQPGTTTASEDKQLDDAAAMLDANSMETQVIASYGAQLMDWLNRYTFVEEQRLAQQGHPEKLATFLLDELLANGTTTAVIYCSVHPQ